MIPVHVNVKTTSEPGPDVLMHCPACKAQRAVAATADVTKQERLYGLIPVSTSQYTTITCRFCGKVFRSPLCWYELARLDYDEISDLVAEHGLAYVGFITKFCIVLSILLGALMFFGLGCSVVGVIGTWGKRTRWRIAAIIGFVI